MVAHELQEFVMWNYDRNNYTDAHWVEDELEWSGTLSTGTKR